MATQPDIDSRVVPQLPKEVLIKILSLLPQGSDLASAALVSRNFHVLVQEFLYCSLHLNIRCSEEEIRNGKEPHTFKRFSCLIDHLSASYKLG